MNKSLLFVVMPSLFAVFLPDQVCAQEAGAPSVQRVPVAAHWRVAPWGEHETGSPAPAEAVEITKSGQLQKVEISGGKDRPLILWMSGGEVHADNQGVLSSGRLDAWTPQIYSAGGTFFGTQWVAAENWVRQEVVFGVNCDVYETTKAPENERWAAQMMGADPDALRIPQKAWIDATTRLPVAVETPEGRFRYTFFPTPTQPLELPGAFRQKQKERDEEVLRQQSEAGVR